MINKFNSVLDEARVRLHFLRFTADPGRTDLIFKIVSSASRLKRHKDLIAKLEDEVLKDPQFSKDWIERYIPRRPSDTELEQSDNETLAGNYHRFLKSNGFEQQFYPDFKIERPLDYMLLRLYSAHDLWHILLGYKTDREGEMQLQAFSLAQIPTSASVMLLTAGYLNALTSRPSEVVGIYERVTEAYLRGKATPFLLGFRIEEMWQRPVSEIRTEIGLSS